MVSFCISVKINDIIFSGYLCVCVKCLSFAHFSFWLFITFLLICRASQYFLVNKIYVSYVCCKYNNFSLCGLHFQSNSDSCCLPHCRQIPYHLSHQGSPLCLVLFGIVFFPIPLCRCFCLWLQLSCCSRCSLHPGLARRKLRGWKKTPGTMETADMLILFWLAQQLQLSLCPGRRGSWSCSHNIAIM